MIIPPQQLLVTKEINVTGMQNKRQKRAKLLLVLFNELRTIYDMHIFAECKIYPWSLKEICPESSKGHNSMKPK